MSLPFPSVQDAVMAVEIMGLYIVLMLLERLATPLVDALAAKIMALLAKLK